MISSRLTLAGRPTVANGLPLAMQASIRSCRPTTSPVDCGPMMLLPPLKMVRSAPAFQKRVRVDSGGHSEAASTISGTPALLGDAHQVRERDRGRVPQPVGHAQNGRRVRADRRPQRIGGGRASVRDLHEGGAGQPQRLVVGQAVDLLNDHLRLHAGGVGKLRDPLGIGAGDAGRRRHQQPGRGAGGHVGRLHVQQAGDAPPDRGVQVLQPAELAVGRPHDLEDLRVHHRAAVVGHGAGGVDQRAHAQFLVDSHASLSLVLYGVEASYSMVADRRWFGCRSGCPKRWRGEFAKSADREQVPMAEVIRRALSFYLRIIPRNTASSDTPWIARQPRRARSTPGVATCPAITTATSPKPRKRDVHADPMARTTASGSRSITVNRTRAARSGTRRPCSQSCRARASRPKRSANFCRLSFMRLRSAMILSAVGSSTIRHGSSTSPRTWARTSPSASSTSRPRSVRSVVI